MATVLITAFILFVAIIIMAIGVIIRKNKSKGELKGSCGGPEVNPDCCMKNKSDCKKKNCD